MRELRALLPYLGRYRGGIAMGVGTVLGSNAVTRVSLEFVRAEVERPGAPRRHGGAGRALRPVLRHAGAGLRAALAHAVARDAPILVLDDALSAVDTQTEHGIP